MKISQLLGIIAAAALIIFSVVFPVPEKRIRVSSNSYVYDYSWSENRGAEYVGGDAYNYQMEASLKAGYMSGILAIKAITFVGGLLLLFLTLFSRAKCQAIEAQTRVIAEIANGSEACRKKLEKLSDNSDEHAVILNALLAALNKCAAPNDENSSDGENIQ